MGIIHERHAVEECLICNLFRCNQRPLLFYLMKIHSEKYRVILLKPPCNENTLYVYHSHSLFFINKLYIHDSTTHKQNLFCRKLVNRGLIVVVIVLHKLLRFLFSSFPSQSIIFFLIKIYVSFHCSQQKDLISHQYFLILSSAQQYSAGECIHPEKKNHFIFTFLQ